MTGVRAELSGDGPHIAVIGELDGILSPAHPQAAEGYAHACGHHCQMTALLGAALALTDPQVREALDGAVTFFAVPAEEYTPAGDKLALREAGKIRYGSGKSELVRLGEFDDIDMALTSHVHMVPSESDLLVGNNGANGFISKTITLHGKAAHAAAAPHAAVNALNAASLGFSALGMIRETFLEQDYVRVHPIIKKGGDAVNVVPHEVVVETMVRARTLEAINETSEKVNRAYEGAAWAIGATAEIRDYQGDLPVIEQLPLDAQREAMAALAGKGLDIREITPGAQNVASTDVGDLSYLMPVVNFTHGGFTGALHAADFAITDEEKAYVLPAKMMALTAYHLLKDGAAHARKILQDFTPAMTKEEYIDYIESME